MLLILTALQKSSERQLLDPFDPVQALPKSAEFLNELRGQFGNLGLAAAAYNAGPRRVQDWLAGSGNLPQETRNYVVAITGSTVDDWAAAGKNGKKPDRAPTSTCRELMALLRRAPNPFVAELNGELVGYADLQANGYIDHFFVSGTHARRGIGSLLMKHLLGEAKALGLSELSSDVSRTAQPFYEKFGFVVIEQRRPERRGVIIPNALMKRWRHESAEAKADA